MTTVELSTGSIFKTILILLGLWVAYFIKDILLLLFVVVLLAVALEPIITKLSSWRVPRVISILAVYLALFFVIGLTVYLILPPLVSQLGDLANNLPAYLSKLSDVKVSQDTLATQKILDSATQGLSTLSGGIFNAMVAIFGGIFSMLTVLTLTFYLLIDEGGMRKAFIALMPLGQREKTAETMHKIGIKLGNWLRGQISLMLIVGALTALGLSILDVPYALALGLLAALLELVPIIGPIIAGLAAVLIAFVSGAAVWQLIAVVILYTVIQQVENQILVPKIMNKAVGVSPIGIIVAILIGGKLLGLTGAMLAIPVVTVISVISSEYFYGAKARNGTSDSPN